MPEKLKKIIPLLQKCIKYSERVLVGQYQITYLAGSLFKFDNYD
jgi:hypothetical protein